MQKNYKSIAMSFAVVFAVIGALFLIHSHAETTTGIYTGVFAGGASDLSDVKQFESKTSKNVSIINSFLSWGSTDNSLKVNFLNNVRNHGSIPMITWEPWNTSGGINQSVYSLKSIINGSHDAYIKNWATSVKNWDHPLFLRFAHEMNGNWYPWSEQVNGNSAGEYVQAWRHVYDIFEQVGANKKVTWVWCTNKIYSGSASINNLYPGDRYVDWTAFDAYNRGTASGLTGNQYSSEGWQTFAQLVTPTYRALNQIAPAKPQMLAEFGSVEQGGDKADWFTKAFKYELKANFPRIRAEVYFNQNKIFNNLVDSSVASATAYSGGVGLSYYATSSYGAANTKSDVIPGKILPLLYDAQSTDTTGPYIYLSGMPTTIPINTNQTVEIKALDKSGVSKIELSVNDSVICSGYGANLSCNWRAPTTQMPTNFMITATDTLGNETNSIYRYQSQ